MSFMRIHLKLIVSGKVHGVNYRRFIFDYVHESNAHLRDIEKITGYVKNLKDHNVEIGLESTEDILEKMILIAYAGPIISKVECVKENWDEDFKDYQEFHIEH